MDKPQVMGQHASPGLVDSAPPPPQQARKGMKGSDTNPRSDARHSVTTTGQVQQKLLSDAVNLQLYIVYLSKKLNFQRGFVEEAGKHLAEHVQQRAPLVGTQKAFLLQILDINASDTFLMAKMKELLQAANAALVPSV